MLPGPVFNMELVTTARRARYYVLRFVYGIVLLLLIWERSPAGDMTDATSPARPLSISEVAALGRGLFRTFAIAQSVAILLLTPALVAGVIADERQRKTLGYLLASRLSGGEIVLGKLAARLLHIGVFLTLGVPVQFLLGLFGGVPPEQVVLVYAGTCSTVVFISALSVLVSTQARRPRDAVSTVYLLVLAWLFVPTLVATIMPSGARPWLEVYEWLRPLNQWVGLSGPFYLLASGYFTSRGPNGPVEGVSRMVALQAASSLLFVAWSVARLRPSYRKAGDSAASRVEKRKRILPRPACGDDAMLWKERYVSRASRSMRFVRLMGLLPMTGILGYALWSTAKPAFAELSLHGYSAFNEPGTYGERLHLSFFLRAVGALVYAAWIIDLISAAGSSITSEREEDTWTSLIATPLDGWEIVRAKMLGAVWGTRWLGLLLLALWLVGLLAGSVHPFGMAAVLVETAVFVAFATALGCHVSLYSKSSARALTATAGVLLGLNGGYLLCCIPLQPDQSVVLAGVTPYVEAISLVNYNEAWDLVHRSAFRRTWAEEAVATGVVSVLFYGVGALALALGAAGRFDQAIDRPMRSTSPAPPEPGESQAADVTTAPE